MSAKQTGNKVQVELGSGIYAFSRFLNDSYYVIFAILIEQVCKPVPEQPYTYPSETSTLAGCELMDYPFYPINCTSVRASCKN